MKKGISKEQILEAALELADERQNMRTAGFRDIARRLGCAHTNLYNYFDSFESLLWAAKEEILRRLYHTVDDRLKCVINAEDALEAFFGAILDTHLSHTGWFYLAWFERRDTPRPKSHKDLSVSTVDALINMLTAILAAEGSQADPEIVRRSLHNTNAYVHGELTIYLAGRGLIQDEKPFREYVIGQASRIMRLQVSEAKE